MGHGQISKSCAAVNRRRWAAPAWKSRCWSGRRRTQKTLFFLCHLVCVQHTGGTGLEEPVLVRTQTNAENAVFPLSPDLRPSAFVCVQHPGRTGLEEPVLVRTQTNAENAVFPIVLDLRPAAGPHRPGRAGAGQDADER